MSVRDAAIKLAIFFVVTVATTAVLASILANTQLQPTRDYAAVITNASGLKTGDDVRVNGVPVGKVSSVVLKSPTDTHVGFSVANTVRLTKTTTGAVRYKNLIGDRYLELIVREGSPMAAGGTIPSAQMAPGLDVDKLVNGFRPLLQGLDPDQTNDITRSLVQVFSGQTDDVADLLEKLGRLTDTVADRDAAIGGVITNLNQVLAVADRRSIELDHTVDRLQQVVSGLNGDRSTITNALTDITGGAKVVADLFQTTRPSIAQDITGLQKLADNLNVNKDTLSMVLGGLPNAYNKLGRAGGYGNFINFFLCGVAIHYPGPNGGGVTPMIVVPAARCQN